MTNQYRLAFHLSHPKVWWQLPPGKLGSAIALDAIRARYTRLPRDEYHRKVEVEPNHSHVPAVPHASLEYGDGNYVGRPACGQGASEPHGYSPGACQKSASITAN